MQIALIGFGKVGQTIAQALAPEDSLTSIIDPHHPEATATTLTAEALKGVDVAIDFSTAEQVPQSIETCLGTQTPLIIGTTGWDNESPHWQELVARTKGSILFSPNFSVGVYLFLHLSGQMAKACRHLEQFDLGGFEIHHRHKQDMPSGTAKEMARRACEKGSKQTSILTTPTKALDSSQLQLSSLRLGSVYGMHHLYLSSPDDFIELKHTAMNRQAFAKGALGAARWLLGKKGWFSMDDYMKEIIDA